MAKQSFLFISLQENKAKKLAQAVSNDSCRKILDYLSNKEATESELAEKLQLPISTVHYNLQQLMEAGLISAEEFHYSEKGKEVRHYKSANKYIVIAPKNAFGIKEKLNDILPVALIAAGTAGLIQLVIDYLSKGTISVTQEAEFAKSAIVQKAAEAAPSALSQTAQTEAVKTAVLITQNIALWLFG